MLLAGPWGSQEQRNWRELHCFQQDKLESGAVPAGEGSGWGLPQPKPWQVGQGRDGAAVVAIA